MRYLPVQIAAALALAAAFVETPAASDQWPQWGGPTRDFHAAPTSAGSVGLADTWPAGGPPIVWTRPLGTGHSAIVVDDNRLFTMYRAGNGRGKVGPWSSDETVAALDARTGATIWEHSYPARSGFEDFSFGPGPHATPLVAGDRVFTVGTNQQLFAFDKRSGKVLWSHDLIKEFKSPELLIRPVVKAGYGCSPIAFGETIICSVGGPGQSVMAFRQSDGGVVWKSGDFLTSGAAPILIQMGGRPQIVFLAGGAIVGLDPVDGQILWAHPHDPGNDLNCGTPIFGPDNVLFVSSAYQAGSRAIRLTETAEGTDASELWFTKRVRFMFLSAVRIGDFVYGTTGDFGPAFLTALNIKTGESAWQVRGFARASLLAADGKVIVMNEDGDLALARMTPTGADILARTKIFDTVSWTAPTLVGTTLYARDREKIVAIDLAAKGANAGTGAAAANEVKTPVAGTVPPRAARPATDNQRPSLAGSWKLDATASTVTTGVPFAGVHADGAPPWLFVTQPSNGTLIIESPMNTGHTRFYRPGKSTTTDIANGTITMHAVWNRGTTSADATLVAEGQTTTSGGVATPVKEKFVRDGEALVVEIVAGGKTSTLRYTRLLDLGACKSWPTPCK